MHPFRPVLMALPMAMLMACSPATQDADAVSREAATAQVDKGGAVFPTNLQAAGVEPFWGVKVEGETLAYTTPETMETPRLLKAMRSIDADGLHLAGEDGGAPFRLDVRGEACSDGMSDREYPFSVSLLLDGKTSKGCAFDPATPPPPQ